jgi:hypothetical protein
VEHSSAEPAESRAERVQPEPSPVVPGSLGPSGAAEKAQCVGYRVPEPFCLAVQSESAERAGLLAAGAHREWGYSGLCPEDVAALADHPGAHLACPAGRRDEHPARWSHFFGSELSRSWGWVIQPHLPGFHFVGPEVRAA